MSLAGAAAALGLPEALVQRSAEARAAETGSSVDDILAAWAGGESAPAAAAPSADTPAAETPAEPATPEPPAPAATPAPVPEPVPLVAEAAPEVVVVQAGPYKPPKLIGARDNPARIVSASLGLFLVVLLVGLIGPALSFESPGARTSEISYSAEAEKGQVLYASLGCATCHTQMVRPIVADVGLGPVSLNDSNQVLGLRRYGPDLSDVGSRLVAADVEAIIEGGGNTHAPHMLSDDDMSALVAYMAQSRTSG